MTMCLTTNTSQGITTRLQTRAQRLRKLVPLWATPLIPRANTTQHLPTPASTRQRSTPHPTSRITTPPLQPLNPTLSPSQLPTPQRQRRPGPGSVCRSRQHSPSPTHRRGGRPNRPTRHPLLASTCYAPHLRRVRRAGTPHSLARRLKTCTPRWGTRGAVQGLEEELTRFPCQKEGWKIIKQGLHRVLLISPAR